MKVKTIIQFHDAKEDILRNIGDIFEVSKERHEQVEKYVEMVEAEKVKNK